ncbi:glycosyltransferase family 2 protein [Hyphococcus luteus]|uniref:Dolichol-phosphate mannosyltransferase n=1 Tax=Hyphococcus luteus TaxID=2058213 RepID=A0A2S7K7J8_9PROT|nr:glycosyltransferase family 2 protein [Marinicaulis flavus]PQA88462.1 dolichol-phosphate mannosyltransferase [Marinicaulis flavus]
MSDAPSLTPSISVVAPMHNEAGGAGALAAEIAAALADVDHEIILVDDASSDDTLKVLKAARAGLPQLRILRHEKNAGQSRAVRTGVLAARGAVIAMLDGDGQNDPADIPALYRQLMESNGGLAMVAGERRGRQDSAAKKAASRAANAIRKKLLNDGSADTGCGLKVFRRDAFLRLPYFDHMHRYLPALMAREGFGVAFAPVSHRARAHGRSKYTNFGRALVAVRDLMGVMWLRARAKPPGEITEEA